MMGNDQRWLGIGEAPRRDQTRIIGIELTAEGPTGERAELEMLAVKHTLPYEPRWGRPPVLLVTVHTTRGDRQARIEL